MMHPLLEFYLFASMMLSAVALFFLIIVLALMGAGQGNLSDRKSAREMAIAVPLVWLWPLVIPVLIFFVARGVRELFR